MEDLGLLVMHSIRAERNGWFHGGERKELEEVIRHHVAQRAGHVKVSAAFFHAYSFGHGDLDVVNKPVVPYRLKNTVAEAEDQDVLDGLFAEVMINAENLVLIEGLFDLLIEMTGGFQIIAKGFLKDDAAPLSILLYRKPGAAEQVNDVGKEHRTGGQIKEAISVSAVVLSGLGKRLRQPLVGWGVTKRSGDIIEPLQQPFFQIRINFFKIGR